MTPEHPLPESTVMSLHTLSSAVSPEIVLDSENTTYLSSGQSSECIRLPNATYLPHVGRDTAVVSYATEKTMYQALQLVASVVVCIAGIPTNFINVTVFFRMGLKDRVNLCLFWLSFCDMMTLTSHVLRCGELAVQFYRGDEQRLFRTDMAKVLYDYGLGFVTGFRQVSFFMYAFIALDRCLCVRMPLRIQHLLTNKLTASIVILGSAVCFILNGFSILSHGTLCVLFLDTGSRGYIIGTSQLVKSYPEFLRFSLAVDSFVMGLALPMLFLSTVIISTAITAVTLRRREDWLRQVTFSSCTDTTTPGSHGGCGRPADGRDVGSHGQGGGSGQEAAITRMLVMVSSVYVFCTVPLFLHRLVRFFLPGFYIGGKYGHLMMATYYVNSFLVNINAAVNFVVFYWQGTRFRKHVQNIFCSGSSQLLFHMDGDSAKY